jgi:hypothetical protein
LTEEQEILHNENFGRFYIGLSLPTAGSHDVSANFPHRLRRPRPRSDAFRRS